MKKNLNIQKLLESTQAPISVDFNNHWSQIEIALKKGYTIRQIWEVVHAEGFNVTYSWFKRLCISKRKNPTAPSPKPAQEQTPTPSKSTKKAPTPEEQSPAAPAVEQTSTVPQEHPDQEPNRPHSLAKHWEPSKLPPNFGRPRDPYELMGIKRETKAAPTPEPEQQSPATSAVEQTSTVPQEHPDQEPNRPHSLAKHWEPQQLPPDFGRAPTDPDAFFSNYLKGKKQQQENG